MSKRKEGFGFLHVGEESERIVFWNSHIWLNLRKESMRKEVFVTFPLIHLYFDGQSLFLGIQDQSNCFLPNSDHFGEK